VPSSEANDRSKLPLIAIARGSQIPIAERAGTASYVPLPAVSSLGGFQTPAAVGVGMFVTAGVWKPSQIQSSAPIQEADASEGRTLRRAGATGWALPV
jgi:hypothetical protein